MIAVYRTATMIAILTKWSQPYFWGLRSRSQSLEIGLRSFCEDHSPKKSIVYEDWDHDCSPSKNVMFLSFYRIVTMIAALFITTAIMIAFSTKMFNLSRSSQRTEIMSSNHHINIAIISRLLFTTSNYP